MDPTSLLNSDNSSKRKLDHLPETKVTTQGDDEDPEQPPKKKSKVIPDQEKRAEGAEKKRRSVHGIVKHDGLTEFTHVFPDEGVWLSYIPNFFTRFESAALLERFRKDVPFKDEQRFYGNRFATLSVPFNHVHQLVFVVQSSSMFIIAQSRTQLCCWKWLGC